MSKLLLIVLGLSALAAVCRATTVDPSLFGAEGEEQVFPGDLSELGAGEAGDRRLFGRLNEQVRQVGRTAGESARKIADASRPVFGNIKADSKDAYQLLKNNPRVQKGVEYVKPHLESAKDRGSRLVSHVPILKKLPFGRSGKAAAGSAEIPAETPAVPAATEDVPAAATGEEPAAVTEEAHAAASEEAHAAASEEAHAEAPVEAQGAGV